MKDEKLYLIHIIECIQRIEEYVAGGREQFMSSRLIQDAVYRNLQTMAESTQRLSDPTRLRYPAELWRKIAGFRNVLVHDYLGLDPVVVWEITQTDLPQLKKIINEIMGTA